MALFARPIFRTQHVSLARRTPYATFALLVPSRSPCRTAQAWGRICIAELIGLECVAGLHQSQ